LNRCCACDKDIYTKEEHYLVYYVGYLDFKIFCDEDCLITYLKENGDVEER
jgi:hypothetical protein